MDKPQPVSEYWFLHSKYLPQVKQLIVTTSTENLATLVQDIAVNGEERQFRGEILLRDGKALTANASEQFYNELEERLIGHVRGYISKHSYGIVQINDVIDVVVSTLVDYPALIQEVVDIDPNKVQRLQIAGVKAIEKRKNSWLILANLPESMKSLYQQIQAERRLEVARSRTPFQQPL